MRALLVLFAALAACSPVYRPCYRPPTYHVLSEHKKVDGATVAAAWAGALDRARLFGCPSDIEVWIRPHVDDPLLCAGRPPYYSCTSGGHTGGLYYVEVDLEATVEFPPVDVLRHEFVHVLLLHAGVPSVEHHAYMRATGWTITPDP